MTNIFEALREDHDKQRTLAELLIKTHGESQGREELFARFKNELESHAGAEERYFYRILMKYDLTQDKARHSVSEHKAINDLIEQLERIDMSSSAWLASAGKLTELVLHHLGEEEHEVFQLAGKVLNASDQATLAKHYRQDMSARMQA